MKTDDYKGKPIIFCYYKDGEYMGNRCDTFNTISKEYAKIYQFSREQVDIVLSNIKSGCNRVGKSLAQAIKAKDVPVVNIEGQTLGDVLLDHLSKTEDTFREWGEFEIRVIPFPKVEEWYELQGEGEEWKRKQFIENLEPAIEIHKFKVIENEN